MSDWTKDDIIDVILARYKARIGNGVHPNEPERVRVALRKLTRSDLWAIENMTSIDEPSKLGTNLALVK